MSFRSAKLTVFAVCFLVGTGAYVFLETRTEKTPKDLDNEIISAAEKACMYSTSMKKAHEYYDKCLSESKSIIKKSADLNDLTYTCKKTAYSFANINTNGNYDPYDGDVDDYFDNKSKGMNIMSTGIQYVSSCSKIYLEAPSKIETYIQEPQ